jgi:hypothetical protein
MQTEKVRRQEMTEKRRRGEKTEKEMRDEKQQRKKERCEERESWRDVKTYKVGET